MDAEKHNNVNESLRPDQADNSLAGGNEQKFDGANFKGSLWLLTLSLGCAVFLVSVDRTIVAVAIPHITDEFHSYADVGWYGSAYLICVCVLQPLFGRIYSSFDVKLVYLSTMVIFEAGSLVCALAPNSSALIVGRAIAGCGSGGILSGSFVVVAQAIPLRLRPAYTGAIGMIHSLGATAAPLIGGAFTTRSTWRWCFWLNLPLGIPTIVAMCFLFHPQRDESDQHGSIFERLRRLDLPGATLLLGSAIMLLLALQYAAAGVRWSSSLIAGLLVGAGVTVFMLGAWLAFRGDDALIPPRILTKRTVTASSFVALMLYGVLVIHIYYLPTYFQAIQGSSAIGSAVKLLPYISTCSVFSLLAGVLVSKTGVFTPPCIFGCGVAVIGAGLLTTLGVHTNEASWVGFQLLSGIGAGLALYQGFIGVQAVLPKNDAAIGTSLITFSQTLGGALAVSVGDAVLLRSLRESQDRVTSSSVNIDEVIALGATGFRMVVPESALAPLLRAYNHALSRVFVAGAIFAALAFLASFLMEFKSIKSENAEDQDPS